MPARLCPQRHRPPPAAAPRLCPRIASALLAPAADGLVLLCLPLILLLALVGWFFQPAEPPTGKRFRAKCRPAPKGGAA